MVNSRETGERRILGALAVISNQSDILLIKDPPKVEVAGAQNPTAISWWSRTDKYSWGLPGGGRGVQSNGQEETLLMTLSGEFTEEVTKREGRPHRRLPSPNTRSVTQQPYPNVVAQEKKIEGESLFIHQFGVTSVHIPHAGLTKIARKDIQRALDEERAVWISLQTLIDIFNSEDPRSAKSGDLNFRPQVLMTAYIWYLTFSGISPSHFNETIIESNKGVISFVAEYAARTYGTIKNGSFDMNGRLAQLNTSDRLFLLGKQRQ